jgi:protein-tyrosine phosphatase
VRVLFVCSGNICRSPTAEAVLRRLVGEAGLADEIEVDSAGTGSWHVGEPPDERATVAAARRGLPLPGVARQVSPADFEHFDLILSVDEENLQRLRRIAPPGSAARVRKVTAVDVPDPYYGGPQGFDDVLDMLEDACRELLDELRQG